MNNIMAKRKEHTKTGVISGVICELCNIIAEFENFKTFKFHVAFKRLILAANGSYIGSRAPDYIEPPKSPNHRFLFHSIIVGFIVLVVTLYLFFKEDAIGCQDMQSFYRGVGVGYTSHLLLDYKTPKGLPVI